MFRMNNEIFLELRGDLCIFLERKLSSEEAADIIQEVYLRWQNLDLSNINNPRAFLFTIALNMIRDKARRRARAHEYAEAMQGLYENNCTDGDPALRYDERAQLKSLLKALDQLPEAVRHAFLLFRYDGLTHAEIALQLGISKKTVSRHIQRASEHCLAVLAQYR